LMDECEILDWDHRFQKPKELSQSGSSRREASGNRSSHKQVEMASDNKTPLYVRDGQFGKTLFQNKRCVM
jgi:hypothetical protein